MPVFPVSVEHVLYPEVEGIMNGLQPEINRFYVSAGVDMFVVASFFLYQQANQLLFHVP